MKHKPRTIYDASREREKTPDLNLIRYGPDRFMTVPAKAVEYTIIFTPSLISVIERIRDITNTIRGIINA